MIGELIRQIESLKRRIQQLETQEAPRRVYWPFQVAEQGQPATATGTFMVASQPSGIGITPVKWTMRTFVVAPNDGTKYWTVYLMDDVGNTIGSFDTKADTADASTRHEVTVFTNTPVPASNFLLRIHVEKTGAVGNFYGANQLLVRLN